MSNPSAPLFEILDICADVGIIGSSDISDFCNDLVEELKNNEIYAHIITDHFIKAHLYVVLANPSFSFNHPDGESILVLLDGTPFKVNCGFEGAFARLTTDKKMKDAKYLAQNIQKLLGIPGDPASDIRPHREFRFKT